MKISIRQCVMPVVVRSMRNPHTPPLKDNTIAKTFYTSLTIYKLFAYFSPFRVVNVTMATKINLKVTSFFCSHAT